jgi:hypothetical protein
VEYAGRNITYHLFTKDFFISVINLKTGTILGATAVVYLFVFFFFSIWWYLIVRFYPGCLYGATTYVEAFTFSIVTHMTIGYGNTGPQQCWAATWLLVTQTIVAVLLEAIVIGIVFARISHPKQRSRSIFISDSSIIARRDGILKFMFRVADVRRTQVSKGALFGGVQLVSAHPSCFLHSSWGLALVLSAAFPLPTGGGAQDITPLLSLIYCPWFAFLPFLPRWWTPRSRRSCTPGGRGASRRRARASLCAASRWTLATSTACCCYPSSSSTRLTSAARCAATRTTP